MSKRYYRMMSIEILAYAYRFVYPILIMLSPIFAKEYSLLVMGIGLLLYAAYTVIGYQCRWKHIFCAWQLLHRQSMTPNDIRWHMIKKLDVYSLFAMFDVIGVVMIIIHLSGLWLNW